jgi:putative phosphoesterase
MKIAVLSDTHNNEENLKKGLAIFNKSEVDMLIHCGDVSSIDMIHWMSEYTVILSFGNGDFITGEIRSTLKKFNENNFADFSYQGEFSGKQIGVTHGHIEKLFDDMVQSQKFDYVLTGHTHRRRDERVGKTRIINPGALGGMYYQTRSVCILDPDTDELTVVEIV